MSILYLINPLQRSCLENLRNGGASWAAVYGVAQSRTQLKQLSSSSNSNTYHSIRNSSVGSSFLSVAGRFMIFFSPARTVLVCMTLQIFFLSNNYICISVVSIVVEITGRGETSLSLPLRFHLKESLVFVFTSSLLQIKKSYSGNR